MTPEQPGPSSLSPRAQQLKADLLGEFSLSVDDVAGILEVDRSTVYRYIQDGALAGLKIGREYRLSEADVRSFLEALIAQERQRVRQLRLQALGMPKGTVPVATASVRHRDTVVEDPPAVGAGQQWGQAVVALMARGSALARERGHALLHPGHVLLALISDTPYVRWATPFRDRATFAQTLAGRALKALKVPAAALRDAAERTLPPPDVEPGSGPPERPASGDWETLLGELAGARALLGRPWVGTDAVLWALATTLPLAADLEALGATPARLRSVLAELAEDLPAPAAGPRLASGTVASVQRALDLAAGQGGGVATPVHLLLALVEEAPASRPRAAVRVLTDVGVNLAAFRQSLAADLAPVEGSGAETDPVPSPLLRDLVETRAPIVAQGMGHPEVGDEHLLLAAYGVPALGAALTRAGAPHAAVRVLVRQLHPPLARPIDNPTQLGRYSERSQRALQEAAALAKRRGDPAVSPGHVLLALLASGGLAKLALEALPSVNIAELERATDTRLVHERSGAESTGGAAVPWSAATRALLVEHAVAERQDRGHAYVGTEHLLLGLFADPDWAAVLEGAGATRENVLAEVRRRLGPTAPSSQALPDAASRGVLARAEEEAAGMGAGAVHPAHLLLGVTAVPGEATALLERLGVNVAALRAQVAASCPRHPGSAAPGPLGTTAASAGILQRAAGLARQMGASMIAPVHLLAALYQDAALAAHLAAAGAPEDAVRVELGMEAGA